MISKVLVTIDGSAQSLKGIDLALEFAQRNGSQIMLLEVVPAIPVYGPAESRFRHSIEERNAAMIKENEETLAKAGKRFEELGIPYQAKVVVGDPAEEILRIAEEEKITIIIIGNRGLTGATKFLLGSVSSKVISHAHCNVLVTK